MPDEAAACTIVSEISGVYKDGLELLVRRDLTSKLKDSLVRWYEMEVAFEDEKGKGIKHTPPGRTSTHTRNAKGTRANGECNDSPSSAAQLKYPAGDNSVRLSLPDPNPPPPSNVALEKARMAGPWWCPFGRWDEAPRHGFL